jgi:hypothetical protein
VPFATQAPGRAFAGFLAYVGVELDDLHDGLRAVFA